MRSKERAQNRVGKEKLDKIWGGFGENTHRLEKNAKMLEKINTIICIKRLPSSAARVVHKKWRLRRKELQSVYATKQKESIHLKTTT